jgi:hypothetical protein
VDDAVTTVESCNLGLDALERGSVLSNVLRNEKARMVANISPKCKMQAASGIDGFLHFTVE